MDKKAQVYKLVLLIPKAIFITIIALTVYFLIYSFIITNIDTRNTESHILINRILFSPNLFSYSENSRAYPGIIDAGSFNEKVLEEGIYFGENTGKIAAKLTLKDFDGNEMKSIFYNKVWYERLKPLAETGAPGPGGAKSIIENRYVLLKENNGLKKAALTIDVVTPNP